MPHPADQAAAPPHLPPDSVVLQTERFAAGIHPTAEEVEAVVAAVLDGTVELDTFGRWLVALADAGETTAEIAGVAAALRARMVRVPHQQQTVVDTCGTGGDGSGSFNISTAAAIVVAGAGLPVAKHGNRAVSSRTGSADVLERLGVKVDGPAAVATACLQESGLAFCLAPTHHPALSRVGPLRRSLGRPTVFNLVGPLCNPAGATVQVIGVGRGAVREAVAEAAVRGGARRVLVVSSALDAARSTQRDLERDEREAAFAVRALDTRRQSLTEQIAQAREQIERVSVESEGLQARLAELSDEAERAGLQQALEVRIEAERLLSEGRARLDALGASMRAFTKIRRCWRTSAGVTAAASTSASAPPKPGPSVARTTRSSPAKKRPAVQATATVAMERRLSSEGAEATSQNRV
jgi:anthranilate phosphoribosyltransferase